MYDNPGSVSPVREGLNNCNLGDYLSNPITQTRISDINDTVEIKSTEIVLYSDYPDSGQDVNTVYSGNPAIFGDYLANPKTRREYPSGLRYSARGPATLGPRPRLRLGRGPRVAGPLGRVPQPLRVLPVRVLAWYSFGTLPRPLSYRTSTLLVRLLRPGVRLGP